MITAARSAQAMPGKLGEAIALLKEIAAFVKSKHGLEVQIKVQIAGPVGRLSWISNFDSLADYEATSNKILADKEYHALVGKAAGAFIPGHTHETLWRTV
jgi:hypothetical protein